MLRMHSRFLSGQRFLQQGAQSISDLTTSASYPNGAVLAGEVGPNSVINGVSDRRGHMPRTRVGPDADRSGF